MRFHDVAEAHGARPVGEGGIGLSGGEALRLMLVRAAIDTKADIILADEPTAHLDETTAREIGDGLLALAKGRTLVVATHDPALAARMDRIIRLGPASKEAAA
jgi:ATP-binding cassette subfamily C protein CydD